MIKEIKEEIIPKTPEPFTKTTYKCDFVEGCEYFSIQKKDVIYHIQSKHCVEKEKVIDLDDNDYLFCYINSEEKYNLWVKKYDAQGYLGEVVKWTKPEWFVVITDYSEQYDSTYTIITGEEFLVRKMDSLTPLIELLQEKV